ncbi:MAG TPA: hypothetical protein VGG41_16825 [Solirubrobacteraceae bacterium]|jgi:hypothetical protein
MADAERQLALEGAQRLRVAVLAVLSGLLFFGGQIWITLIGTKEPTIGLLQGLAPAFNGLKEAAVDPRTIKEQFLVHHQVPLIAAFALSGIGVLMMIAPMRYLSGAERRRAATPSPLTSQFALAGPVMYGVFLLVFEISLIIGAHNYLSGTARTYTALNAATGGGVRVALQLILTLGTLLLAVVFIMVSLRSMRVGLLTRMMGTIGIISGVLFLIPLTPLPVIQSLWLIFFGAMLLGFGNRPLPEAWAAGEARPWPPRQPPPQRQPRGGGRGGGLRRGAASAQPAVPAPSVPRGPSPSASKKRKRRR